MHSAKYPEYGEKEGGGNNQTRRPDQLQAHYEEQDIGT